MNIAFKKSLPVLIALAVSCTGMAVQEINIDKAVNSPSITIRYTKMRAAMIELKLNGASISTRKLTGNSTEGETNFSIDVTSLTDGDNKLEVLIYDAEGRLLGTQTSTLQAEGENHSAVQLQGVKQGETVRGAIEIKLGVNRDFREMYVSFFVDEQWKALKNFPPYSYIWDTTGMTNGWHEVQAWVVDENNNTFKTRKVKVYVNNPGGRTERVTSTPTTAPKPEVTKPVAKPLPTVAVKAPLPVSLSSTTISASIGKSSGMKRTTALPSVQADQRLMMPTGARVVTKPTVTAPQKPVVTPAAKPTVTKPAVVKPTVSKPVVKPAAVAPIQTATTNATRLTLGKGTRLPNLTSFNISLNNSLVAFDVMPRVEDGVALTPFRHLFEHAGGKVKWDNTQKRVSAKSKSSSVDLQIGRADAKVNGRTVQMERRAFIDHSRTIVPLSFFSDALNVNIEFDKATNHVLITEKK
ncbi:MAG: hypothetical protein JNM85_01700 [Chthonomonas sp.]|nr:hypothetical protein [Chthonomonas sp.]